MVMVGAASHHLMIEESNLIKAIKELFSSKEKRIIDVNLKAYEYGREAAAFYRQCLEAGIDPDYTYVFSLKRSSESFTSESISAWKEVFKQDKASGGTVLQAIKNYDGFIPINPKIPRDIKNRLKTGINTEEIEELLTKQI
jgi:hypothetical protein